MTLDELAEQAGAWEWLRGWKGVRFDDCRCGDQYCSSCSFVAMIQRVAEAATQAQREQFEAARASMSQSIDDWRRQAEKAEQQLEAQREQFEQAQKERDERFTEADVRALMLDAADEWERMPLTLGPYKKTMGELVDSLLAEHKAQQSCATPTNSSPPAATDAPL